jgi:predicted nuclease of predicted toxin-antitoxin system
MRFKLDENLPADAAILLRDSGHDAMTVLEQGLGGAPDAAVMERCRREKRALVTLDVGLGDIRTYPPSDGPGCLVIRLARLDQNGVLDAIRRILPLLKTRTVTGTIWVIDEWRVRIRETGR